MRRERKGIDMDLNELMKDLEYIHRELSRTDSLQVIKAMIKLEEVIDGIKILIYEHSHSDCGRR